ncbi:hypothetical protein QQF64_010044 [Cirrhinus molitorella]|uniref:Uncharacterized protein n=1 Tax=Cirrhinus molitorella TaxID=172907 RepID=A0ABR3M6G7_9TELE
MKARNYQNKSKVESEIPASVEQNGGFLFPDFAHFQVSHPSFLLLRVPLLLYSSPSRISRFCQSTLLSPALFFYPLLLSLSLSLPLSAFSSFLLTDTSLFRFLPFFTDKCREAGEGEGNLHRKESKTRVLQVKKGPLNEKQAIPVCDTQLREREKAALSRFLHPSEETEILEALKAVH